MLTVRMFMCAMAMLLTSAGARGEKCQPLDLDATSRVRRDAAVAYLAAVNGAQMQRQKQGRNYAPLNELTNVPHAPVGFVPKLLVDRWSYLVSLKDYLDVCGFALFSDERGVIYEAYSVTPSGAETDAATDENPGAR